MLGGKLRRCPDRLGGVLDLMVRLVIRLEALEDQHRLFDRRLADLDFLETPRQRPVPLEGALEVLIGGAADAAQPARGQRGLEKIGRIHRAAVGRPGADDGVDFVDEQDRVGVLGERLEHGFEPLLELAAELGPGEQRAHVQRVDDGALQGIRDRPFVDPQRQALGHRRLAHPRLAHVERIVLPAAAKHLDGPLELHRAADQRVDSALLGLDVQVGGECLERIPLDQSALFLVLLPVSEALLRRPMGDVIQQVQPADPFLL